jgi:histidinol-phosphate phosphatase family protein
LLAFLFCGGGLDTKKTTMIQNENIAVFLDRDGTIIEDRGHLGNPSDVVFFPETFEALWKLREHFALFIVTNQPGISKGLIKHNEVNRVNIHLIKTLAEEGIEITDIYVCPHSRTDDCICIKPKPYFLKKAAVDYRIDLHRSFVVGDHPHDVRLAMNAGARGIYLLTGHGRKHLPELPEDTDVVAGISRAADKILSLYRADMSKISQMSERTNLLPQEKDIDGH